MSRNDVGWALALLMASACSRTGAIGDIAADAGAATVAIAPTTSLRPTPKPADTTEQVKVGANFEDSCTRICEQSHTLNCNHAGDCMPHCLGMAVLTPCASEITRFYECLVHQPTRNWECSDDGVASIRDGFCDDEEGKMMACMQANIRR